MITAKDAEVGTTYLVDGLFHTVTILKKHGDLDSGYCSSVLVQSETEPLRQVTIAGGTELIPYSKELHKPVARRYSNHNHNQEDAMKKKQPGKRGAPRSQVIDRELAKVTKGGDPKFEEVAAAVIKAGCAPASAKDNIVAQSRARWGWYKSGAKKNPALAKPESKKS